MRIGFVRRVRTVEIATVLFLAFSLGLPAAAQVRSSLDKKTSPRALAVIQQLPGGNVRLFPVSIFLDGKYYDARFYYAKPVPLALYDETLYQALSDGMPVGEFTVHTARQIPDTTTWWGEGDWNPMRASEDKPASAKSKPVLVKGDKGKDEDRPVLKRAPGSSEGSTKTDSTSTDKSASKPEPTFKPDEDSDRPVLRKPKEGTKPEPQVTEATGEKSHVDTSISDPNRPVLRRKQPVQKDEPVTVTAPKTGVKGAKYLVAISDPDAMNNRPYNYTWSASEKAKWTEQMSKIAMETMRKYASSETRAPLQPNAKFAETHMRAVDLDYSNAPYIILSGRIDPIIEPPQATKSAREAAIRKSSNAAPPPASSGQLATFYVTVVARLNSQDELTKLLTLATDSLHLDLNPRLDLIDAVDADGDNRAELLFRKTTDSGSSYVLYRMTPFDMTQVFEGGSGN